MCRGSQRVNLCTHPDIHKSLYTKHNSLAFQTLPLCLSYQMFFVFRQCKVAVICRLHLFTSTSPSPSPISHPSYHGHQMKGLIRGGWTQRDHIKNAAVGFRSNDASNVCFKKELLSTNKHGHNQHNSH